MKFPKLSVQNPPIQLPLDVKNQPIILGRFVGYILLTFSLIDYVEILVPTHFIDPVWEFQTMGQLVEHIWAPLLGLTFVFIQQQYISRFELQILSFLSWLSLIFGLLYLLMLPLGINDSITIYNDTSAQITDQAVQQKEQFSKLKQLVNKAQTNIEIHNLDKIINPQSSTQSNDSPQSLKNKLSRQVETLALQASNTAKSARGDLANNLMKKAVKVNLGTVLAGVSLITVWHLTDWVRIWRKWYA
ncbi:MAG: HpsJ family protein [Rhizonema sp. NSF051]|nr:HpsJ family protein [Rhizonema sp. NSF051]